MKYLCLVAVLFTGCAVWHSQVNFGDEANPSQNAPSTVSDFLDFTQPGEGGGNVPEPPTEPPVTEPPTEPPAPPPPSNGDEVFLWKPVSETTGNLVVLTPASGDYDAVTANGEPGRESGRANENRQHWRWNSPGSSFGTAIPVLALKEGVEKDSWTVPNGGERWSP